MQYVGNSWSTGEQFDASWDRGAEPFEFPLGAGQVIPGWDQGIAGMKQGGRRLLVIPPELAYGAQSPSPDIAPNETLLFVVDLEKIRASEGWRGRRRPARRPSSVPSSRPSSSSRSKSRCSSQSASAPSMNQSQPRTAARSGRRRRVGRDARRGSARAVAARTSSTSSRTSAWVAAPTSSLP